MVVRCYRAVPALALLLLLLASCRAAPLAPATADSQAMLAPTRGAADFAPVLARLRAPLHGPLLGTQQVPLVWNVRSGVRGDTLYVRVQLAAPGPRPACFYSGSQPGGWMVQLLVDADQQPTGYWDGYDYIVRGGELLPDGDVVVRQIAPDDRYPGGWGPQSGEAALTVHPRDIVLAIPLSALGGDDGAVNFLIETYATVPCETCGGNVTQNVAQDWFGTTGIQLQPLPPLARR